MNLGFDCGPTGLHIHVSTLRRRSDLENWFLDLVVQHRRDCPYCNFKKDSNTGRELGR